MANITDTQPTDDRLLRLTEVLKAVPVSRASWYNGIKAGIFPPPIKLSERTSAWRNSHIQAVVRGEYRN